MIRLHMIVEGQTEESFVNNVLANHLGYHNIVADVRCIETSRKKGRVFKGGMLDYKRAEQDIRRWMREDRNDDARFTTMFDLYALPDDFPRFMETKAVNDPYERVSDLEKALKDDIGDHRFVPYIQLHEFESLLLSDPGKFLIEFIEQHEAVKNLEKMCSKFKSPELIDDGSETAPSKRIIKELPEYKGRKVSAGPRIAQAIGIDNLRKKCRHFSEWLNKLETLV